MQEGKNNIVSLKSKFKRKSNASCVSYSLITLTKHMTGTTQGTKG